MTEPTVGPEAAPAAPKPVPAAQISDFRLQLAAARTQIGDLLPEWCDVDRFMRICLLQQTANPQLRECTPQSKLQAVLYAAEVGLEPGGVMGHAALIPRKIRGVWTCCFEPMYRGLIDLAWRAHRVVITVGLVYPDDVFELDLGSHPRIVHRPGRTSARPDSEITHAYAVATFPDGRAVFAPPLDRAEIERIRLVSRAGGDGPWSDWWGQMAIKSAVKRTCKLLPSSRHLSAAIELDTRQHATASATLDSETPAEVARQMADATAARTAALKEKLALGAGAAQPLPVAESSKLPRAFVPTAEDDLDEARLAALDEESGA